MSRRFDKKTNVFNQNGRINQIEYALKAIKNSNPALAISFKDGIVIATEKKTSSSLLVPPKQGDKIHKIDDHLYVIVSGLTSDANYLIEFIRNEGQKYRYNFGNHIPIENLVEMVCNLKQSYTQSGGMRPFGTSFIFVGWDEHFGFQIYTSDPSGNLACWKAIAQGTNEENSNNLLQENFKEDLTQEECLLLSMKNIMKTLDTVSPEINRLVFAVVDKAHPDDKTVRFRFLSEKEKEKLVQNVNDLKEDN